MKIDNIVDIITNSSSELFIFDESLKNEEEIYAYVLANVLAGRGLREEEELEDSTRKVLQELRANINKSEVRSYGITIDGEVYNLHDYDYVYSLIPLRDMPKVDSYFIGE